MSGRFIFDLDDTLIPTTCHYINARKILGNFILNEFKNSDLTLKNIEKMFFDKEFEMIKKVGFNTEMFPQSLEYVYKNIAEKNEKNPRKILNGCEYAYQVGKSVFDENIWSKTGLYSGVEDVLDFLVNSGDELFMITLGDSKMQRKKIKTMGLDKWFTEDNIHVDLRKKKTIIRNISSDRNKDSIWFVGNSYNSDICPALDSGIGAIYIPQDSWSYNGTPNKNHERMIQLENILEIKNIYNSHLRR